MNIKYGIKTINNKNATKHIWKYADLNTPRLDQQIALDLKFIFLLNIKKIKKDFN